MLHDHTKNKTIDQPFVSLKPPLPVKYFIGYQKPIPKVVLDKKKFHKRPFTSYLGYDIRIDFNNFLDAQELLVDKDNWAIIGWR